MVFEAMVALVQRMGWPFRQAQNMPKNNGACMRIQLIGLGHVGQSLIEIIDEKKNRLKSLGLDLRIVSVSDSSALGRC